MGWLRVIYKALIGGFALRSQRFEHYRALHFLGFAVNPQEQSSSKV